MFPTTTAAAVGVSFSRAHIIERMHFRLHYFKRFRISIFHATQCYSMYDIPLEFILPSLLPFLCAIVRNHPTVYSLTIAACGTQIQCYSRRSNAVNTTVQKMQNKQIVAVVRRLRGTNIDRISSSSSIYWVAVYIVKIIIKTVVIYETDTGQLTFNCKNNREPAAEERKKTITKMLPHSAAYWVHRSVCP